MTTRQMGSLGQKERDLLDVLVAMHGEFGLDQRFTGQAVEHIVGHPCPGSLAGLAMKGYVAQQSSAEGICYLVTEQGYQLFANIEGQL